mmetsp:Transcript_15854/g.50839  ORF Transcript_15854/g.50839 Transcript_15854/m.50839 type:complete len:237 (+) Transcript_15854:800-1510(+)
MRMGAAAAIAVATPAGHISFGLSGKTNGEKKLAQAVGLVDTLARKAAHGIDVSTLAVGAVIVFKAEPADIAGEVTAVLRLHHDKPHWAEKDEPTMAFVRTGGPGMAKAPPSLERQLKQLKKIRSDNGRKGAVTAKSPAIRKKSAALKKKGSHGVGMLTAGDDKPNAVAAARGSLGAGKRKTGRDGPFTDTQKEGMRKLKAKGLSNAEIALKFKTKGGKVATSIQVRSATRNNFGRR